MAEVRADIDDERCWDELREREADEGVPARAIDFLFSIIDRRELGREMPDGLVAEGTAFGFAIFDADAEVGVGARIFFLEVDLWVKL